MSSAADSASMSGAVSQSATTSQRESRVQLADPEHVSGRYYLRFTVDDHPGVLADIAGVLGRQRISIASVIQHDPQTEDNSQYVPLVIMTHRATEGAARSAVAEIDSLQSIRQASVRMRVLE